MTKSPNKINTKGADGLEEVRITDIEAEVKGKEMRIGWNVQRVNPEGNYGIPLVLPASEAKDDNWSELGFKDVADIPGVRVPWGRTFKKIGVSLLNLALAPFRKGNK